MNPIGSNAKPKPRRDEILESATRLFAERGYDGTSMADLAEKVGLRKASLFHHFSSKDVLYAAVLDGLVHELAQSVTRAAFAQGSYVERLDALSDAITDAVTASPYAARLLVREAMDWGPVMRDKLAPRLAAVLDAAVQFGEAGQRDGAFDPRVDVRQVIVSTIGIHFMPFAINRLVEMFTGTNPFDTAFVAQRKAQAREHARQLVLPRK
jgi:AcrR family transcriptional regulator